MSVYSVLKTSINDIFNAQSNAQQANSQKVDAYQGLVDASYLQQAKQAQQAALNANVAQSLYHNNIYTGGAGGTGGIGGGSFVTTYPTTTTFPMGNYPANALGNYPNTLGMGMGGGVLSQYPPPQPAPLTVKEWLFGWFRWVEDHPAPEAKQWPYDDAVHKLLDRRSFNPQEIDLVALITFCLCNGVKPDTAVTECEALGAEFV